MSGLITSDVLLPYAHVAEAAGLESWALQRLEQARFRREENFREITGRAYLTIAGVRALADALKAHGYGIAAHSLTVLASQHESTPSRRLIEQRPKNSQPIRPAWMERADLA